MNIFKLSKLILVLGIPALLIFLAASNPDLEDFQKWYGEKHGLAGKLLTVAVERENRIFFSSFELGGNVLLKKRTIAIGFGGMLFELED